ncbi:MAG: 30S ribosomal protein S8 [Candidatus Bipolaricaulota bacterium]
MTTQDPIGDMITRIRNSSRMGHESVSLPGSSLKESIAEVLAGEGFVEGYEVEEREGNKKTLMVNLSYRDGEPVIEGIERESKPSRRVYVSRDEIPRVLGGLGTAVLSTSMGLMSGEKAREEGVGGELLLKVW